MMAKKKRARARISVGDPGHARDMKRPVYRAVYENRRLIHEVALNVRQMREARGLTQDQLANMIGSSQPTIARLERGLDQRVPRFDLLRRIGEALGKQLKWVFAEPNETGALVEFQESRRRMTGGSHVYFADEATRDRRSRGPKKKPGPVRDRQFEEFERRDLGKDILDGDGPVQVIRPKSLRHS